MFIGRLPNRSVLRVSGPEVHQFLHGLFTNDVMGLLAERRSLYGCFLNTNGRVLHDAFLLQSDTRVDGTQPTVLLDVHRPCAADIAEHLLEYKLRRKIKVENLEDKMAVLVQSMPRGSSSSTSNATAEVSSSPSPSTEESAGSSNSSCAGTETALYDDPRNVAFGAIPLQRLYLPSSMASRSWNPPEYERLLLASGVGEGPSTFTHGKTLPFEGNIDMLSAVSFHKGCYVGQELTHRTHVMLVTRKRTVPLVLDPVSVATGASAGWGKVGDGIFVDNARVGHLQHMFEDRAVGLLRLRYMNRDTKSCKVRLENGSTATASIPDWWDAGEVEKILKQQELSNDVPL